MLGTEHLQNSSRKKRSSNRRHKLKNKPLICSLHGDIESLCENIEENLKQINKKTTKEQILKLKQQIARDTKNIKKIVEKALEAGQSMENRLVAYYDAITELGFERKKK